MLSRSSFISRRLNSSTFLVVEHNDLYNERPFIYVKVLPSANTLLIMDTGCGGATPDHPDTPSSLRDFLEKEPVKDNGNKPLNPGGKLNYIVVLSHCHYDHILGVEDFSPSPILASSNDPSFLSPSKLPIHSLCEVIGIRTPSYTPTLVPHNHAPVSSHPELRILHTPGHTPDEVALWDSSERAIYVGDTLYEDAQIIFPREGNIATWFASVDSLIDLVRDAEKDGKGEIKIGAGHSTVERPALDVLTSARAFMKDVIAGREKVVGRTERLGIDFVSYRQADGRFSLLCPEFLILDGRKPVPP